MQALNLTSQCLDCWDEERVAEPGMLRLMSALRDELVKAPKFLLPEGGRPIDDPASIARLYTDLRLPFPCVALEYLARGPIGQVEVASGKRIALAWSLEQGPPAFVKEVCGIELSSRRGFLVQSISYIDSEDMWMPIFGMVAVDLQRNPGKMRPEQLGHNMVELTKHRLRSDGPTETYAATAFVTVDYVAQHYGDLAADIVSADSSDEVLATLSFAALTMCGNVSSEVLAAPAALNKKRLAKGKSPIFDTRVLMVGEGGYRAGGQGSSPGPQGGQHASPRTHLRRGHIRRLGERTTWVNAAVVNPAKQEAPVPRYEMRRERGG